MADGGGSPEHGSALLALQPLVRNQGVQRLVQRTLRVGPAGDSYEREADAMADEAMRNWGGRLEQTTDDVEESARPTARTTRVSRATGEGVGLEGGTLDHESESQITQLQGDGQPLPAAVRQPMEGAFGADFGAVRVHSGPDSDALNRSMQARAFTVGPDIFFASDEYRPETTSGRHLLAHELTHTIQQGVARQLDDGRAAEG